MMKLSRFLRPYRMSLIIVVTLTFLQALSDLYLPTLMSDIVDTGVVNGDISYILKIGGFMLLVAAGGMICSIVARYLSSTVSAGFGKDVRSKVFSHVAAFSLKEVDQFGTASLITRTTNDITQVQQVLNMILRMMISAPLMCIGGVIMAVFKDIKLSFVIIAVVPVLVMVIFAITRKSFPLYQAMQSKLDKLNLILNEGLTGIRVIRSFNRTDHEKKRFDEANSDLIQTAIRVNQLMASLMPMMMLVLNFSTIAIIWFGGIRIDSGAIQVGDLMAFLQYAMQIMFSLIMVSMMFIMIPRSSASAARINEVLEIVPDIKDGKQAATEEKKGVIEFRDVTFRFPWAEKPALSNISFSARSGETIAIIGGTGSGKSALVNLIPRFYDVDSGSILIDGVDIRDLPLTSLREKIGFVPQKAVLFSGTILDNIRFGKESASEEEVKRAAEIAQADEFVSKLQDGYQTVIAQRGLNVSGGQKQRLTIARAIVKKPEIYIFDDSFSALDFKTEAKLRTALKQETANSTVFIVAQRVSTVMDADRIIVLDRGKIAGIGKHQELMDTCKVYREIVLSQLSEEEIA
ncbi:ABC transporter ATP-binding protein [Thermoactinomyces sp. CICC 10522]|uniref:ABC transporter ATP-binding protein n=1 Tax=Thermoactinomyces sp. CICC 10522 TaxID=2767427 RepID=UPI0018DCEE05|nr:ABC transporter ATP-binding protein [Thermoactinomyces sp. CICC 10522]